MHDKGLQRNIRVDRLVSIQEGRAAVVLRLYRGSTARRDHPTVYMGIRLFVSPRELSRRLSPKPWGTRMSGCFLSGPSCRRPVLAQPALPHRRVPPRPDLPVECPGFGFDELGRWCAPSIINSYIQTSPSHRASKVLKIVHAVSCRQGNHSTSF